MIEQLNEQKLREQFCAQVRLHRHTKGMMMLETPFTYLDGDQYLLDLSDTMTGSLRVSDGGTP
ncbi:hypothetical protein [Kineobactrum salinum]|uniref:Uncharacterized protein n=1 Tax=Kineobactrum salinum TaxID=2708301 RepID=A0A6C0U0G5_9GAMM|nr:hypothetical protein [Kineobactrum salinum]QIB65602.1 hypothetical protein G3T16_09475 [Kineobactrum salinum]